MTAYNPPLYSFSNLNFNPTIFETGQTSNLTLTQANALYLQKTTMDTATALETFSAGINTSIINVNTQLSTDYIEGLTYNGVLKIGKT